MANINYDIQPKDVILKSAYVEAPFDKGKEQLEKAGYRIISLEENARLRIQEGKDAFVSQKGNWTREGVIYVSKKRIFLSKNSPIMKNAEKATNNHRNENEFYLTDEQIEESLSDSVELSGKSIPTKRFGENKITNFAFGKTAEDYGNFLREAGINEMPVYIADTFDKSFVRQMWFCRLGGGSGLGGDYRGLDDGNRVCGVCEDAIASEPNVISESTHKQRLYSKEQISIALKNGNINGLEGMIFNLLEQ